MKEKVIFTLSLACFIGIMWLSSIINTSNLAPVISEEQTVPLQERNSMDYIDNVSHATTYVDDSILKSEILEIETCSLKPIETDVFRFGDAFRYYRQCLGSDSSFQWKGHAYTTFLSEELIIEVADSVQVKEETENKSELSEIH